MSEVGTSSTVGAAAGLHGHIYAQVAVDQPIDAELTYYVPVELMEEVKVGSRVVVPLGRGNVPVNGTVLALEGEKEATEGREGEKSQKTDATLQKKAENGGETGPIEQKTAANEGETSGEGQAFAEMLKVDDFTPQAKRMVLGGGAKKIKPILDVLREVVPVPPDLLELGRWISKYYATPIGLTLATMVPAAVKKGAKLPTLTLVHLSEPARDVETFLLGVKLSPRGKKIYEVLRAFLAEKERTEAEVLAGAKIGKPMLKRMVQKGVVHLEKKILWPSPEGERRSDEATEGKEENGMDRNAEASGPAPSQTAGFSAGGGASESGGGRLVLSADQAGALEALRPLLEQPRFAVRLVHGVTGSGKTELYIRAIEEVVKRGKRAIVLVPEIALTPQAVKRFTARFERVAVLHSGLRNAQRHLHWHAIATGWAQVIVGARSAVFAPAADLGLIVVDEEHDSSYKQDNAPRYHGRDVAIRRAQMLGIPVLLGSATPALESWHNAHGNPHYDLLSLTSRPTGTQMPRVVIVDMKEQSKERRGLHILSTHLEHHLKQTLEKGKQAIFLLNRRGYAHYISCPRCAWVMMCENCDSTMVVHRAHNAERGGGGKCEMRDAKCEKGDAGAAAVELAPFATRYNQVQCHYCMTAMILPTLCPLCKARLTYLGQGTQRAEDELVKKFPGLRIARMDSDSMRDAVDYQRTLGKFGAGELDLLIGTQMISKGLDFPNVQLVGVLNADLAMAMPDFRAGERTFQLICQVAGRSGRAAERGTVVVQTFQPTEPAIVHACNHDYLGFVAGELPHRQQFGFPPYGRMVRILLTDKSLGKTQGEAEKLLRLIEAICEKGSLPVRWQGPQPPPIERLVEEYRVEIVLFAETAGPLQRLLAGMRNRGAFSGCTVGVNVDVDPVYMM